MAVAHDGSSWIKWAEQGAGEPVVLVMGLGGSSRAWWRLLPHLAGYRTFAMLAPLLYAEGTRAGRPQRIDDDLGVRGEEATPGATILAQMVAVATHDVRTRLHELAGLPVTVIHGEEDALIDVSQGRALTAGIPGARLVTIPACGHMLTTDAEDTTTRAVREHLAGGDEGEAEVASFAA